MAVDSQAQQRSARTRPWVRAVGFCGLFLVLLALYAALFATPFVERWLHLPVSRLVALTTVPVLSLLGEVTLVGTYLTFDGYRAVVVEACNGVLPTYIFLAAVCAFPSRWRDKLWGALLGIPLIYLINVIRVISLMVLGASRPDLVERIHIDVWQTAVVILAMGIWIFWAERFVRRQPEVRN